MSSLNKGDIGAQDGRIRGARTRRRGQKRQIIAGHTGRPLYSDTSLYWVGQYVYPSATRRAGEVPAQF